MRKNEYESPELIICWYEPEEGILTDSTWIEGEVGDSGSDDDW